MPGVRCDGCEGKFGSAGEAEVEAESFDVTDDNINVEVKVSVPCGNCGSELKEGYTSLEAEVDTDGHNSECEITDPLNDRQVTMKSDEERFLKLAEDERTFDCTSVDLEVSDDFRPKFTEVRDRKTGAITRKPVPLRGQRHYYDITGTASITCNACGGDMEVTVECELSVGELESVY